MFSRVIRSSLIVSVSKRFASSSNVPSTVVSTSSSSSTIAIIPNTEIHKIKAKHLEREQLIIELVKEMPGEKLIYDYRLDADLYPFSDNVDQEFLDDLKPPLEPTFNLAHYINRMPTLQRLVDLGVNLYIIEQDRDISQYLVQLDFDRDIKEHLFFLKRIGLSDDELGVWITCNPLIFRESIKNLEVRLEYLKRKKFDPTMVSRMIRRYPPYLNVPIKRVDAVLGCLQKEHKLTGDQVRSIISCSPKLILFSHFRFKEVSFSLRDVMEFNEEQSRQIVVGSPSIFYRRRKMPERIFSVLHWDCGYSKELIAASPYCLTANLERINRRTKYLKALHLFQSDPTLPCFTSLNALTGIPVRLFIEKFCHTSVADYNKFLKTL